MEIEALRLVINVVSESIKILGPAIVASYATYKVTSMQNQIKLEELEKGNSFKAKEYLLKYYESQENKIGKAQEQLSSSLGQLLGFSVGIGLDDDDDVGIGNAKDAIFGTVKMHISLMPFELESQADEFETVFPERSKEVEMLRRYYDASLLFKFSKELGDVNEQVHTLLEMYSFLGRCNRLILSKKIEQLFG